MTQSAVLGRRIIHVDNGEDIEVVVYQPRPDDRIDFVCEFSLKGLAWNGKIRQSFGIDGVQAVFLALQAIGSDLDAVQLAGKHKLSWVGASADGDIGFPTIKMP
jgi:hypothetical protein